MLLRQESEDLIAITQPAHAWLSGQMARAWGNERFGEVEPFQETCLAAEQHDCGWLEWEERPSLNPETSRPVAFFEVPVPEHLRIWRAGPRLAEIQNPYAGLLVSLHGTGLYARYRSGSPDPEVRTFMASQALRQVEMVQRLAQDSLYSRHVTPEVLKRNQTLLATWDLLSLHFCLNGAPQRKIQSVPGSNGDIDIELKRIEEGGTWSLDPWPFRDDFERFTVTGKRLPATFDSEDAMREALERAPWVHLEFILQRAGAGAA